MSQSTISIRVDHTLKSKFDSLCETFGLTTSAAFHIFMKAVVRERRIPFEIKADENADLRKHAMDAFESLREQAAAANLSNMTLEEINEEINSARNERRKANLCGN
ncbi:MAG: type II toxin-antitoxin system RelB/DinJ family antitoxin [Bacteroides sp.]|nr:type II toxin-antitoxin system RelB/DinJ family antitoxin [Bacteroides sp.]